MERGYRLLLSHEIVKAGDKWKFIGPHYVSSEWRVTDEINYGRTVGQEKKEWDSEGMTLWYRRKITIGEKALMEVAC